MDPTVAGLVVALQSSSRVEILLLRTRLGWGMPVGASGEPVAALLTRVQASILVPGISLSLVTGPRKDFDSALGRVTYELAVTGQATLRPYLNSDDWRDARFASFDEAFHIIQKDQDDVLKWAERGMKKSFTP